MVSSDWTDYLQDNLKKYFTDKGFSEEELRAQLKELSDIVMANATTELLSQKPPQQKFTSEDEMAKYIKSNFTDEEFDSALKQQADTVFKEYVDAIDPGSSSAIPAQNHIPAN